MEAVEWRPADVPLAVACRAIGLPRATLYQSRRPRLAHESKVRAPSPRRLSDEERRAVIDTLTSRRVR
jgi:putative transposase